jgi:hypothetical protein
MPTETLHHESEFTLGAASPGTGAEQLRQHAKPARAVGPTLAAFAALALVIGALAAYFFWSRGGQTPQQETPRPATSNPSPQAPPEAAIKHPVEQISAVTAEHSGLTLAPMPELDDSDIVARDTIEAILNGDTFLNLLVPRAIIRHIVATVDNLPRKSVAIPILPLHPAPEVFATAKDAHGLWIAHDNAGRYARYVAAAESIDSERLAQFYVRLYPLFQQAYVDLGYPNGYFNDRLIGVIDHLLDAPEPKAPVYLAQPKVLFEFADPEFEELSAGQKILVRVGIDNELRLKAKLREIRKVLAPSAARP